MERMLHILLLVAVTPLTCSLPVDKMWILNNKLAREFRKSGYKDECSYFMGYSFIVSLPHNRAIHI